MSKYNACDRCIKNDNGYCRQLSWRIDKHEDTSECVHFEEGLEEIEVDILKILPNIYTVLKEIEFEKISSDYQKDFCLIQKFYDHIITQVLLLKSKDIIKVKQFKKGEGEE